MANAPEEVKQVAYGITVSTLNGVYLLEGAYFPVENFVIEAEQLALFLSRIKHLASFSELPDEPILKMVMLLPEAECDTILADFNANFPGQLTATTSGYGSVDIIETGLHKAWGLEHLLEKWGISAHDVMSFGDGGNDIELLSMTPQSFAMANAPDNVKAVAANIAPSNKEQGVFQVIEKEVLASSSYA